MNNPPITSRTPLIVPKCIESQISESWSYFLFHTYDMRKISCHRQNLFKSTVNVLDKTFWCLPLLSFGIVACFAVPTVNLYDCDQRDSNALAKEGNRYTKIKSIQKKGLD